MSKPSLLFTLAGFAAVALVALAAADFMRYTKSKLSREVNRLTGWRGPVFDRRYEMTVVTTRTPPKSNDCDTCSASPSRKIWSSG